MKTRMLRLMILLVVVVGVALAVVYRDDLDVVVLERWVAAAGPVGPMLFMVIYAIGTVFFLPASVLTLAGGALFGPVAGTFYNLAGATLGATIAFVIARYLASEWVERKVGGRLKQLKKGVEGEGWRFVAFVRLVPLFPFVLLNYALGLTRIGLLPYVIASYLCMLPGAIAYTYLGYAGREAMAGHHGAVIQKGSLALALLAMIVFLPRLVGRLRQKSMLGIHELKQRLDNGDDILVLDVRTPQEYAGAQGHIAGSKNIPLKALPNRLAELADHKTRLIVLVCRTDRRSRQAAKLLMGAGFANVCVAADGMSDWSANGFSVVRPGEDRVDSDGAKRTSTL